MHSSACALEGVFVLFFVPLHPGLQTECVAGDLRAHPAVVGELRAHPGFGVRGRGVTVEEEEEKECAESECEGEERG